MRTWDRIRLGEFHKLAVRTEWNREPVIVLGDEVAQMILDGMKPEYPVCAPPWDDFVIEMQPSPWPITLAAAGGPADLASGVLLSFTNMTERYLENPFPFDLDMASTTISEGQRLLKDVHARGGWVLGLEMFADLPGGVLPIYWTAVLIDADGSMTPLGSAWSFMSQRSVDREDHVDRGSELDEWLGAEGDAVFSKDPEWIAVEALLEAGMMVVSMVNCSNIGLDDETPAYDRHERRRLSRKDKPALVFKRLHIKQHTSRRSDGKPGGEGGVAIHLVRGHFKTFTPERPLLGKHVGTYWWQPMLRGTEQRIVLKDYAVDRPTDVVE